MKKEIHAEVSVGRNSLHQIVMTIRDQDAGVVLLRMELTPEQFGNAISGLTTSSVAGTIWDTYRLAGATYQTKQVAVPLPTAPLYSAAERAAYEDAVFPEFETDGWEARREMLWNHHYQKGLHAMVTFVRYVDPTTGEPLLAENVCDG